MKTKIKPFTLKTYIKEVKGTNRTEINLSEIPENFDFTKVTAVSLAPLADIMAKMTEVNGLIYFNSAAGKLDPSSASGSDCWAVCDTPNRHDFGFTYYEVPGAPLQPATIVRADDNDPSKITKNIYQDNEPEDLQPTEAEFLSKANEVLMAALQSDGSLWVQSTSGDDCNELVTLVVEENVHTKGIYFRGIDGQEHKLNQDLPELAELEKMFTPDEQHSSSNVIIYEAEYLNSSIVGIVDSPSLEEIRQNILNGAQIWLQLDDNAEPTQYLKLVSTDEDAAYFIQLYISGKNNFSGCYKYDNMGQLTWCSFTD